MAADKRTTTLTQFTHTRTEEISILDTHWRGIFVFLLHRGGPMFLPIALYIRWYRGYMSQRQVAYEMGGKGKSGG